YQEADFERYIQAGGGFVGIHSAADSETDWGWYGRLLGGYFGSEPELKQGKLTIVDKNHPSTKGLPDPWEITDEWYTFKKQPENLKILMTVDKSVFPNKDEVEQAPVAWFHEYDGGRSFYTGLGHEDAEYADANFLK